MVMLLLDREHDLGPIVDAEELDLRNVRERDWGAVLGAKRVTRLTLYHIVAPSLPEFSRLTSVETLSLTWATKVATLEPVFGMLRLRHLTVSDFSKLRDLDGVERLSSLSELHLSGNMGSLSPPLRLAGLAPVAGIKTLEVFSLRNARLEDDDITVLAECAGLRQLELSNQFEKRQYAYLAKRLNGQLEAPICAHQGSSLTCKACGGEMLMVTGRPTVFLCPSCDPARLRKAEADFARMVAEA